MELLRVQSIPLHSVILSSFLVLVAAASAVADSPRLFTEAGPPIARFVAQAPAGGLEKISTALADLLEASSARCDLLLAERSDSEAFLANLSKRDVAHDRVNVIEAPEVTTAWPRDRFVAARAGEGVALLHQPGRLRGELVTPLMLAERHEGWSTAPLPFFLEGGDLVVSEGFALIGPHSLGIARRDTGQYNEQLATAFQKTFGVQPILITAPRSGSTLEEDLDHHLDMAMTVLADGSVMLADVRWGERLAPPRLAELLKDDPDRRARGEAVTLRLEASRGALAGKGLIVRRVPAYLIPGETSVATYANVLQEVTPEGPVVYLPWHGLEALDSAAAMVYRQLGYEVRPINVRGFFRFGGSLRCIVNVVERRAPTTDASAASRTGAR